MNVAGDFVVNLLGGIVEKLIPRSWIHKGLDIMAWLVAVPDYTARVSTPGGGRAYGFAGVNDMRGLYTWMGVAIAPLTLIYATSRAFVGQGDPPHIPVVRVLVVGVLLINYGWLWSQAVALTNQLTHAILGVSAVTSGIEKMFEVLIAGAALGGLPLIGLLVMGAGALQLIAMIFVKVTLILVGALVFAIGPLMIGLVPTERGNAFARAWLTMALGLFVLPFLWAAIFAIAAVLSTTPAAAPASSAATPASGRSLGGLLIAMAAIAGFWLNIKLTKALCRPRRRPARRAARARRRRRPGAARRRKPPQLTAPVAGQPAPAAAVPQSLRGFASKVGGAASGAAGALVPAGRGAVALAGAGALARGGLIGAGSALASKGLAGAANSSVGRAAASSRAGTVATRAARGAQRGWKAAAAAAKDTPTPPAHTEPAIEPWRRQQRPTALPRQRPEPAATVPAGGSAAPGGPPTGDSGAEQARGEGQHDRGPDIQACSAADADTAAFNAHEPAAGCSDRLLGD